MPIHNVEEFAQIIHEAGREAVLKNKVLKKDGAPEGQIHFKEWSELDEDAKEGRRIQAVYLLSRFTITKKRAVKPTINPVPVPPSTVPEPPKLF